MDFRDTPEEAEFRREVGDWLDRALAGVPHPSPETQEQRETNSRWWQQELHAGGWAGITWPTEYGGCGLSVMHEAIFYAETARRDAPLPVNSLGMLLAGPTIMVHGTEAQKRRYLPPILSGEEIWCQGFSEPGAGSDLAGLRTRATPVDDGYVVDGQKVWTSFAHLADRCMLLARVGDYDPADKHAGITYLLAPMDAVEVRPLVMINGDHDFNEMFLDGVHVEGDDVLGEVGEGWSVALTTLGFERSSLAFATSVTTRRALDALTRRLRDVGAADDPVVRDRLATVQAGVETLRVGAMRVMSAVQAGRAPGPEGSTLKLVWAQTMQDLSRLAVEAAGAEGVHELGEAGRWVSEYLRARGNSIEGGTDEIQRSILAERVLGLPRSR